jgi:predicted Zn-dependent protease
MRALRIVLVAVVLAGCATNPATGRRQLIIISEQEEVQIGLQSDAEVRQSMGVYDDPDLQRYVDEVGQRLAQLSSRPDLPWTFAVVDEKAVNAFALPGGFIYLTRGILPFLHDESELAAVLGHEIGHVDGRHGAEAYSRQVVAGGGLAIAGVVWPATRPFQSAAGLGLGLMFLSNSRDAELESDRLGVGYASAAGWQPTGMSGLLGTLARLDEASGSTRGVPNWALTHPPAADRVVRVQQVVAAASGPGATATNQTDFERYLDGLVFGDSREKGIVRGREFLHPILQIGLSFPSEWIIANSDEQVVALETEDGNVAMVLQIVEAASGSISRTARTTMTDAGFQEESGQETTINGLTAYVGRYSATAGTTPVTARAAHIRAGGVTYLLAGVSAANDFQRVDDRFSEAISSFRELSQAEADRVQPDRVDFRVVRQGETWASLAGLGGDRVRPSSLAIMNGYDPGTPPRAGERVRIVVAGF